MTPNQIAQLTNSELFKLCQTCGTNLRTLQKEFASYLYEVDRRKLFKKYNCHTLYEFAAKFAGLNTDTVDDIMGVHQKIEDKPELQELIAKEGWSKVKVVANFATKETARFWAEKVQNMSKPTLKTYMKELRKESHEILSNGQRDLFAELAIPGPGPSTPVDTSQKSAITFKLDDETETKLRTFKQQLEKRTGEMQDWNQTIKAMLEICSKKEKPSPTKEEIQKSLPAKDKRYIPARVKKYLQEKYQGRCGFPKCKNLFHSYHHTERFALNPNHNPDGIVPVCKQHEQLAHHGLIENENLPPENWKIRTQPDKSSPKYAIDQQVQKYRMAVAK